MTGLRVPTDLEELDDPRLRASSTVRAFAKLEDSLRVGVVSDAHSQHAWAQVAARWKTPAPVRPWRLALVVGATVFALATTVWLLLPVTPSAQIALRYAVRNGSSDSHGRLQTTTSFPAQVQFTEGTQLSLHPGGQARIAEVFANGATVSLEEGHLQARVVHRPNTRWTVLAGPFAVHITGTTFDVSWRARDRVFEVDLHEGALIIDGPLAPRRWALHGGQRLVAHLAQSTVLVNSEAPAAAPTTIPSAAPKAPPQRAHAAQRLRRPAPEPAPTEPAIPWATRIARGEFGIVVAEAEAQGVDKALSAMSDADLMALADAARYTRRLSLSARALEATRSRFPRSPSAERAVFLMGRLVEEGEHDGARALHHYDLYLAQAPNGPFAAEALGRKLIITQRLHGASAARALAGLYLKRFPSGTYAHAAREITQSP